MDLNFQRYNQTFIETLNIDEGSVEVLAARLATNIERYDFVNSNIKRASYEKRFLINLIIQLSIHLKK